METVVFFFKNNRDESENKMCSRTLLRIAFIDSQYQGVGPKPGEYWRVDVSQERRGPGPGCFIVRPLRKAERTVSLIHGNYDMSIIRDVLIITPRREPERSWMLSRNAKKELCNTTGANAVVVNLGGEMWT